MSKFTLKLEQLVQTNQFGDMLITIQYDASGPKIISLLGENIDPQAQHLIDVVLRMANFMLAKGATPIEISQVLKIRNSDAGQVLVDDVMYVLSLAIEQAPDSVQNLNTDILMEIQPEINSAQVQPQTLPVTNFSTPKINDTIPMTDSMGDDSMDDDSMDDDFEIEEEETETPPVSATQATQSQQNFFDTFIHSKGK